MAGGWRRHFIPSEPQLKGAPGPASHLGTGDAISVPAMAVSTDQLVLAQLLLTGNALIHSRL